MTHPSPQAVALPLTTRPATCLAALMAATMLFAGAGHAQDAPADLLPQPGEVEAEPHEDALPTEELLDAAAETARPMTAQITGPDGAALGEVTILDTVSGMAHVMISLSGLPEGRLGVHIHETGACKPDFAAAGGHLAGDRAHGINHPDGPHPGDMPNIHVPESGAITVEYFLPYLTPELLDDEDGSAFIIHEHADDYASQPTGEAGGRIGCGVFTHQ
ncbi:MAG: superoxide dismutase family protein [Paracoccus sp. (in: a-proteobacteria)]|nr:superoxide dismutase family protein [Paracoccus sp. (in: a-proteobacteria)]